MMDKKYSYIKLIYLELRKKGYSDKDAIDYIYRHKIHSTRKEKYLKEHLREVKKERLVQVS
jgi:hypothetical protein